MTDKLVKIVFILTRIVILVAIELADRFILFKTFPYYQELLLFRLPKILYSLGNFDGIHYINIARNGYGQFEQAFFPLFPLLIHHAAPLFANNYLLAGIIISNISCFFGLLFLKKYLDKIYTDDKITRWTILFFLAFPSAFFLSAVYTESVFFMLFIGSLYFLVHKKYKLTAVFTFFIALTRVSGIFILIPILLHLIFYKKSKISRFNLVLLPLFPILGLFSYLLYLWLSTGDPLYFFTSQPAYGANRSTKIILLPQVIYRYYKIITTASYNFQYFIALVELSMTLLVLFVLINELIRLFRKKRSEWFGIQLGLILYSLSALLLPTLTGTFSSMTRYTLLCFGFFVAFTKLFTNIYLRIAFIIIFIIFQIILLFFFTQGYFVG